MRQKVRCPKCGAKNYPSDAVCLTCGANLTPPQSPRRQARSPRSPLIIGLLVIGLLLAVRTFSGWWRRTTSPLVLVWQQEGSVWYSAGLTFSPDGRLLAWGGGSGTIELRRVQDGQLVRTWNANQLCGRGVAFSPDGKLLYTASCPEAPGWGLSTADAVQVWRVEDGKLVQTLKPPPLEVFSRGGDGYTGSYPASSPDGRFTAEVEGSGFYLRHDGRIVARWSFGHRRIPGNPRGDPMSWFGSSVPAAAVLNMSFSPDGQFLAVSDMQDRLSLFRVQVGRRQGGQRR